MKIKRLAIIPARIGSKRILEKNIKMFCGKPMIYYAINAAKKSELFEFIHVSTESNKIKKVSEFLGIGIDFMRPKSLARNNIGLMPVINFVVKKYRERNIIFDEIWLIYACNPFLSPSVLINAAKKLYKAKHNRLISVLEYPVPLEWALKINKKKLAEANEIKNITKSSARLHKKYYDAGSFAAFKASFFKSDIKKNLYSFVPYYLKKYSSVDIDTPEDFEFAKKIFCSK
jgi:pseudaminic acid cytidylyltransferase